MEGSEGRRHRLRGISDRGAVYGTGERETKDFRASDNVQRLLHRSDTIQRVVGPVLSGTNEAEYKGDFTPRQRLDSP
jgi:hypothetical protein